MTTSASDLFIVDNSDADWKVCSYLKDWCELSRAIDIATGYFEIGALLTLEEKWQSVEHIRILMGDEVSLRSKRAFAQSLQKISERLDLSLENEKSQNDFLKGVPAIVEAIRAGKISCRVYRKGKFHAKAYLTHGRAAVIGSFGLVGSSNFTFPGLTDNVELNVQIRGADVGLLQAWYERHWNDAEDVSPDLLRTIERHTRDYSPFEVWIKALDELMRGHELTPDEWDREHSRLFPILAKYQHGARHCNLTASFVSSLEETLRDSSGAVSPEDIFHYIYAVLHSPGYRTRYAEFLKIDFPRLPLTGSLELFRALAKLGDELVALHLLESPKVNDFITRFEGQGDNSIPKKPTWKDGAVWINATQRFEGVQETVWNFHIGGYQVCEKWLKDRKGRTLLAEDIAHYQRVVVALNETIRLMAQIDKVIDAHGGWPGAFQAPQDAAATGA